MAVGRHSYIRFFPSDWIGGTARMPRLHKSVYFDICCYNWDHNKPCPAAELALMLGDLPNWRELVDDLVAANKLLRGDDGSVVNPRAMSEAELICPLLGGPKSMLFWTRKEKTNAIQETHAGGDYRQAA